MATSLGRTYLPPSAARAASTRSDISGPAAGFLSASIGLGLGFSKAIGSGRGGGPILDALLGPAPRRSLRELAAGASSWAVTQANRTQTIQASVADVQFTLMLSPALVVLAIFLFLRDIRATGIPSLTLPVAIVGTFAAMDALGYSLDNLSLMALAVAVTADGRAIGCRRRVRWSLPVARPAFGEVSRASSEGGP